MPAKPKLIADSRCRLGEAPIWSTRFGRLYWLDIGLPSRLFSLAVQSHRVQVWDLSELATGLALTADDDLVIVSQRGISIFDPSSHGSLNTIFSPPLSMHGMRFNDCGCDVRGRLWTGTMKNEFAPSANCSRSEACGNLLCVHPDLSFNVIPAEFGCPNGFVWSPDNTILYVADSSVGTLYSYSYDVNTAGIVQLAALDRSLDLGLPDGSAMDASGFLWNARWGAGCIVRFAPDGRVAEVVRLPADFVTSCAFGGPGLQTLFVTSARMNLTSEALQRQPTAGGVFAFTPRVPGAPVPRFLGRGAACVS